MPHIEILTFKIDFVLFAILFYFSAFELNVRTVAKKSEQRLETIKMLNVVASFLPIRKSLGISFEIDNLVFLALQI